MAPGIGKKQLEELEQRIGYSFSDPGNLNRALTHASAANHSSDGQQYERLEFLGDRVLGLAVSELLFEIFPEAAEGELSLRLNALVSGKTCALIADEIALHEFIRTGTDIKYLTSKRMQGVRADVMEAVIAAIYLDGGIAAASKVVHKLWQNRLHLADAARRDSKTALQEWAHSNKQGAPKYEVIDRQGPDHDPIFTIKVILDKGKSAEATGRSKRSAEQNAAKLVLQREGVWQNEEEQS